MFYGEALESRLAAERTTRNLVSNPPKDFPIELTRVAQIQSAVLKNCVPFWWARSTAEAVLESSDDYPCDILLSRDLLYVDNGWYFFDVPLLYVEAKDRPFDLKYLSWNIGHNGAVNEANILLVSVFCDLDNYPVLFGFSKLDLGKNIQQQIIKQKPYGQRLIRFVLASSAWLRQRLLTTREECPNHQTRKTIKRDLGNIAIPNIKVVQLRRTESRPHDSVSVSERDWHCQWMVRGHWRNQYYASTGDHMPKYIHPYIKGPEDKPLKPPSGEIFSVVR